MKWAAFLGSSGTEKGSSFHGTLYVQRLINGVCDHHVSRQIGMHIIPRHAHGMAVRKVAVKGYLGIGQQRSGALRDIAHMPARVKCAVLGWRTLKEALCPEEKAQS